MTTGPEFKMQIGRKDIAEIVDRSKQLRIEDLAFIRSATYEDVQAAYVLLALEGFLADRRVPTEFQVNLSQGEQA